MVTKPELIVKEINWVVDCFPGCCGADIVYRLSADYPQQAQQQYRNPPTIPNESPLFSLVVILKNRWGSTPSAPLSVAFGAVLEELYEEPTNLIFATDSIRRTGDVHTGAFSTKNFIKWLKDNDLVNIVDVPLANRKIQGWGFTFKRRKVPHAIRRAKATYIKWHNSLIIGDTNAS